MYIILCIHDIFYFFIFLGYVIRLKIFSNFHNLHPNFQYI